MKLGRLLLLACSVITVAVVVATIIIGIAYHGAVRCERGEVSYQGGCVATTGVVQ